MNLGIFGDSFGDSRIDTSKEHSSDNINFNSWPYILSKKLKVNNLLNFSENGSSMFYSYQKFLEHQQKCDIVIFLITHPGRYTKPFRFKKHTTKKIHLNSIDTINFAIQNHDLTLEERQNLEDLKKYYLVLDFEWEKLACSLLLQEISKIKNILIVPCFDFAKKEETTLSLMDIREDQLKKLGNNLIWKKFVYNYRETQNISCHFTKEYNEYVANSIILSLDKNEWTPSTELPTTLSEEFDYYYQIIK